jgi:predicted alpha/beta superfamily hydrolase
VVFEVEMSSAILGANRWIRIYLPPSYQTKRKKRFPVLYVHDGQNAFSTAGPHAAFGWGSWELDLTADRLIGEGRLQELIMVGIDCGARRYREYRGPVWPGSANSDYENYARFLAEELKPRIDREYRTLKSARSTGVMGSSMGGICSFALAWERPDVFGKAASLSGSFQVEKKFFPRRVLGQYNGAPKPLRLYLDSGVTDGSGDDGAEDTRRVAGELKRIGWKPGRNLQHFLDPLLTADALRAFHLPEEKFHEAQHSQHNELYWRLRAGRALCFMFPAA